MFQIRTLRRRTFACGAAIMLCALLGSTANGEPDNAARREMKRQRSEAAHRQRRIIFNNDGNEAVYFPEALAPTAENVLSMRTSPLVDSHVDAIFYCTNRGFGMFLHRTGLGDVLTWDTRDKQGPYADKRNVVGKLIEQGTDPLQIMVEFAREHEKEIFWSMRMNDIHDASNSSMLPRFKKDHPEFLFGTPQNPPPYRGYTGVWGGDAGAAWGGYSGVDYGQDAVREFAFRSIEEVCTNYDIDGVELDFFRSPVLLKSHAWEKKISQEERDSLTAMMRRVRSMTEELSVQRGRPILVAIRVPDSVEYCNAMGVDLERWLDENLVDLMAVGGDFVLSPWEKSVALGHKYGVPVYPVLTNTSRHFLPEFRLRSAPQGYRARAMNAWSAGADGVYIFNLFDPQAPMWDELGDPQRLRKLDKVYYGASAPLEQATRYHRDGLRFCTLPTLSPEYPEVVTPDKPLTTTLNVGEDVLAGQKHGDAPHLKLEILVQDPIPSQDVAVTLNGHRLSSGGFANGWLEYRPEPAWVRRGENRIQIELRKDREAELVVRDLRLHIDYKN